MDGRGRTSLPFNTFLLIAFFSFSINLLPLSFLASFSFYLLTLEVLAGKVGVVPYLELQYQVVGCGCE